MKPLFKELCHSRFLPIEVAGFTKSANVALRHPGTAHRDFAEANRESVVSAKRVHSRL